MSAEHYNIAKDGNIIATITTHEKGRFFIGSVVSDDPDNLQKIRDGFSLDREIFIPEWGLPYIKINKSEFNHIMDNSRQHARLLAI